MAELLLRPFYRKRHQQFNNKTIQPFIKKGMFTQIYFAVSFSLHACLCTNELKKERKMLKSRAYQKLSTLKPCTKCASINIMQALITKRNKPRVRIVAGKVNSISNGLMKASSNASTKATTMAVKKLLFTICTPGKMYASTKTFTVVISTFNKNFIGWCCETTRCGKYF